MLLSLSFWEWLAITVGWLGILSPAVAILVRDKGIYHSQGLSVSVYLLQVGVVTSTATLPLVPKKVFKWVLADILAQESMLLATNFLAWTSGTW